MESDWHGALHFGPGDLWQVLGVQDEQVARPLGARGHHDGQKHTCTQQDATRSRFLLLAMSPLCVDLAACNSNIYFLEQESGRKNSQPKKYIKQSPSEKQNKKIQ